MSTRYVKYAAKVVRAFVQKTNNVKMFSKSMHIYTFCNDFSILLIDAKALYSKQLCLQTRYKLWQNVFLAKGSRLQGQNVGHMCENKLFDHMFYYIHPYKRSFSNSCSRLSKCRSKVKRVVPMFPKKTSHRPFDFAR